MPCRYGFCFRWKPVRAGVAVGITSTMTPGIRARARAVLRITVHDKPPVCTFQLEGTLAGPWVRELEECWRKALARQPVPVLRVDLTGVTLIDEAGKTCLAGLHRQGAEFITSDCLTEAIVDEITRSADRGAEKSNGTEG
jgi:anti-anti-sigma regulatory factor